MFALIRKSLHHPVISGLAVAGFLAIGSNLLGWWPAIWQFLQSIGGFLVSDFVVPFWLFALLLVLALFMLSLIAARIVFAFRSEEPSFHAYRKDEIEGIRWRWEYGPRGMREPVPYCIKCDFELVPGYDSGYNAAEAWLYQCENCGHLGIRIEGALDEFQNYVERQIQLKIRNGSWRQVVAGA